MLRTKHLVLLLALTAFCAISNGQDNKKSGKNKINWRTFEEVERLMKKDPKKIVIDVYTNWCGWCKVMDRETFSDPDVIKIIDKNFYAVKFDAETKDSVKFQNNTYAFKPQYRSNELAIALLQGKMSYPHTVFIDSDFKLLTRIPGFLKAKEFSRILTYFSSEAYKNTSWEDYVKK